VWAAERDLLPCQAAGRPLAIVPRGPTYVRAPVGRRPLVVWETLTGVTSAESRLPQQMLRALAFANILLTKLVSKGGATCYPPGRTAFFQIRNGLKRDNSGCRNENFKTVAFNRSATPPFSPILSAAGFRPDLRTW
jgi:hypothetical protein